MNINNFKYQMNETRRMMGVKTAIAAGSTFMLLLLSMTLTLAFFVVREYASRLVEEAEIAVFYSDPAGPSKLVRQLLAMEDVRSVREVSREEALEEMKTHLGEEAELLERLAENPFEPYLKVLAASDISAERLDQISRLPFVTHVRDNREVLEKIGSISKTTAFIGGAVVLISLATCALLTYYVSAENFSSGREIVEILLILGAPQSFIMLPFLLHGIFINLVAGFGATLVLYYVRMAFAIDSDVAVLRVGIAFTAASLMIGVISTYLSARPVGREFRP